MLKKKEKKEFITDGISIKRRKDFLEARKHDGGPVSSLDNYIHFLMDVQKIFSPFANSKKKTITSCNKL